MKLFFLLILVIPAVAFAQAPEINIIPKPRSVQTKAGSFRFDRKTLIGAHDERGRKNAAILNGLLKKYYGFELKLTDRISVKNAIEFPAYFGVDDPLEGYRLNVSPDGVQIVGEPQDAFYGIQSFLQLLPATIDKVAVIPSVYVADRPRFQYRGMHLDVGRHFMPVEFVKKYIDLMSQYKFNYFHWHLTEDQGWRIEIKKYPKLTEIGSKRSETQLGAYTTTFHGDGIPHEGFYTQEQIKDVVAYAKARYITVIPEIEMPGHSSAALAAYPELGCKADYNYEVKKTWGIFKEVYCPTETTFKFLEDVISEVVDLFPDSPYIHIGGDEVLKTMWQDSPEVKALMEREHLKDVNEVQSYFIRRMEKFINSKGKRIIGWDEILEGGLAPNATVMSWRGVKGGIDAAKADHDVIMTPTDYCYLDYLQGDPATEPVGQGGWLPLEKVYGFDPMPKDLTPDQQKHILGGQGNVWTEYMKTPAAVEYMAFPRMLALAEDVWSTPENKNYADFQRRLGPNLARLDKQGVNFRIPEPVNLRNAVVPMDVGFIVENIYSDVLGAKVHFTLDGTDPTESSPVISPKTLVNPKANESQTIKTIVVLPSGRKSAVYSGTYLKKPWLEADPGLWDRRPGVNWQFRDPRTGIAGMTVGETRSLALAPFAVTHDLKRDFAVTFEGYFNAPVDAIYEFQVESTWDAAIIMVGADLINDTGTDTVKIRSALVPLRAGLHKMALVYTHRGGDPVFRVRWAIKGQNWHTLSGGELIH